MSSTPAAPPPARSPGPSRTAVVVGVVLAVLIVAVAAALRITGDGGSPEAAATATATSAPSPTGPSTTDPTSSESTAGTPSDADYDESLRQVEGLQETSQDFSDDYVAAVDAFKAAVQDPANLAKARAALKQATAYEADHSTYQGAVDALAAEPAVQDPEVAAAYAAFRPDALGTIAVSDDSVHLFSTYAGCRRTLGLSLISRVAHQRGADQCIESVRPLLSSTTPVLVDYARAMTRLMKRRKAIYEPIDTVEALGGPLGAAAGGKLAAAYEAFLPALQAATRDGVLDQAFEETSVADSYPPLLAVLQERADRH